VAGGASRGLTTFLTNIAETAKIKEFEVRKPS
jgi:hypothetical protein